MNIEVDLVSLRACGPAPSEHREDKARNANGIQRGFPWTFHIYMNIIPYHSIYQSMENIYIHNIRVSWGPLMNVDDLKSSQSPKLAASPKGGDFVWASGAARCARASSGLKGRDAEELRLSLEFSWFDDVLWCILTCHTSSSSSSSRTPRVAAYCFVVSTCFIYFHFRSSLDLNPGRSLSASAKRRVRRAGVKSRGHGWLNAGKTAGFHSCGPGWDRPCEQIGRESPNIFI